MRSCCASLLPVLVAAAACGGGSDAQAPSGESWCDVVAASNALDKDFDAVDPQDSAALEAVVDKISDLGRRFRAAAPAEIESQVVAYADTNDRLVEIFAAVEFDVDRLDNGALSAAIDDVELVATDVDVFTVAECGVPLGPDDT